LDSCGSGYGPVAAYFGRGNEALGSVKGGEFFYKLSGYDGFEKDFVPWGYLTK